MKGLRNSVVNIKNTTVDLETFSLDNRQPSNLPPPPPPLDTDPHRYRVLVGQERVFVETLRASALKANRYAEISPFFPVRNESSQIVFQILEFSPNFAEVRPHFFCTLLHIIHVDWL